MPLISREDGGTVAAQRLFPGESTPMGALFTSLTTPASRTGLHAGLAIFAAAAISWPALTGQAMARGPDSISDVAEAVIDAVVNVSTKQTVDISANGAMPNLPPGSPFEEFFEEFFK